MPELNGSNGKLAKIIDDIAFERNILALHAALTAAGAGELPPGAELIPVPVRRSPAQRERKSTS